MKTNLSKLYKRDDDKMEKGVWFYVEDGIGFRIRGTGLKNKDFQKLHASMMKPFAGAIKRKSFSDEAKFKVTSECFVKTCITDWKGIESEDGKKLDFDHALAMKILLSEESEELLMDIFDFASDASNYRDSDEDEEGLGNS